MLQVSFMNVGRIGLHKVKGILERLNYTMELTDAYLLCANWMVSISKVSQIIYLMLVIVVRFAHSTVIGEARYS